MNSDRETGPSNEQVPSSLLSGRSLPPELAKMSEEMREIRSHRPQMTSDEMLAQVERNSKATASE